VVSIAPEGIIFIPALTNLADNHRDAVVDVAGLSVQLPYSGDWTATIPAPPKAVPGTIG